MTGVVGDQNQFFGQGMRGDLGVKLAYRSSIASQIGPDSTEFVGGFNPGR
jgi:hypothetical protein